MRKVKIVQVNQTSNNNTSNTKTKKKKIELFSQKIKMTFADTVPNVQIWESTREHENNNMLSITLNKLSCSQECKI